MGWLRCWCWCIVIGGGGGVGGATAVAIVVVGGDVGGGGTGAGIGVLSPATVVVVGGHQGGAWLTILNADDEDKVKKEKIAIAKAEAAAEAKKSVDVVLYDKDFATARLFTFQEKELPEYPRFNVSHHLPHFGNNITSIQHYNAVCGGWVSVGLAYPPPIKENKPIVLWCDSITQIPSFEKNWEHANIPVAPADYHANMTGACQSFQADMVQKRKTSSMIVNQTSAYPSSLTSTIPVSIRPPPAESANDSEIEVHGSLVTYKQLHPTP